MGVHPDSVAADEPSARDCGRPAQKAGVDVQPVAPPTQTFVVGDHDHLDQLRHRRDPVQERRRLDRGGVDADHEQRDRPRRPQRPDLAQPGQQLPLADGIGQRTNASRWTTRCRAWAASSGRPSSATTAATTSGGGPTHEPAPDTGGGSGIWGGSEVGSRRSVGAQHLEEWLAIGDADQEVTFPVAQLELPGAQFGELSSARS